MERGLQGEWVPQSLNRRSYEAFVPVALPPDPPVDLGGDRARLLSRADRALGRLDGVASILPNRAQFLYQYVRKEALLSSQIEGTQSTLSDLLLYESDEAPGVPMDDVEEVSQYVEAMNHGVERLDELPVSSRLIREIHEILLSSGRGSDRAPGEFRRSQNWLGGEGPWEAEFVPPPANQVPDLVAELERFVHGPGRDMPVLVRAALVHAQFETIHPFLDGNGRVGRLLITLLLCDEEALREPLLYLSLYLKQNRSRYYELLQKVRFEGDWEAWIDFFLQGVVDTSEAATAMAGRILEMFAEDRQRIEALGRSAGSALRLHEFLQRRPVTRAAAVERALSLSLPTVYKALERLQELGIVDETTGRSRNQIFVYRAYLDLLAEGTQPLAP